MQVLSDIIVVVHVGLVDTFYQPDDDGLEYDTDTDPEDLEPPREFPALNARCPLVSRLKTLAARLVPPPPPRWMRVLFMVWMMWCGVTRSAAPWVLGPDRLQAGFDAVMMRTG